MKKNILFYGNCQMNSIKDIIYESLNNFNVTFIACYDDLIEKTKFTDYIKNADVIITQPIHPGYRDTDYLHTEFILENAKINAKIIINPSMLFNFYYFDYRYKHLNNKELLKKPSDYHYINLINYYQNDKTIDDFINDYINNPNLKSKEELENIANDSINELQRREDEMLKYTKIRDCYILTISEYIKNNYKKQLLFYSINHPTKYIFQDLACKIISYLDLEKKINYNIDPLYFNQRGILYKCICNVVEFNIDEYKPYLCNFRIEEPQNIIKKYYDTYTDIDLKKLL